MSYQWRTMQIPLAAGLNTKADPRALQVPSLAVARDCQFDELGGIQTRKPFASFGDALTDVRRIVQNGDELLLFTKDTLYTYSSAAGAWKSRAAYLAPKIAEASVFTRNPEQVACDRAELNGIIFFAWQETLATQTRIKYAAIDSTTGAVVSAPQTVSGGGVTLSDRPRLVALSSRVMLFAMHTSSDLYVSYIEPSNPALFSNPAVVSTAIGDYYDATTTGDICYLATRRTTTTSYDIISVTASVVVATTTKARTCDGPIAISAAPNGTHLQIVRANGGNIQGDYVSIAGPFTDVYTAQAVGTASGTVNQIAAAHRSTQDSSQYRCYAFWSSAEASDATDWTSKYNWVDTGNNLGSQANFIRRLGVASRAFNHDGRVFVWMAFAGESSFSGADSVGFRAQLQNTYFLYRDDTELVAKAATHRAGGFCANIGNLPNVQSLGSNTFAWCGVERRVINVGTNQTSYSGESPREIKVTFDSDEARRCVRLGETLYITGGELRQWDGTHLTEVGFHIYPWYFGAIELASAEDVENGSYAVQVTWRWDNAKGECDRSTTATTGTVEVTAGPNSIQIPSWIPLYVTHKQSALYTSSVDATVEVWRSAKNPTFDSPLYLVSGLDPAVTTGTNAYVSNSTSSASLSTFEDGLADADATTRANHPETGGVLESLAPPPASIITASQDRVFLAGIAGEPYQILYSKLRDRGEVASFHDVLAVNLPPEGGPITALAFLDETLIVFKETAVFALPGEGFDNTGQGSNYGPPRRISSDVGAVSAEAVGVIPAGLIFKSSKGWYLLNRGGSVQYIGGPVASFDSDTVKAVHTVEAQHQVRCLTGSRMLMWDYLVNEWSEWTISDGLGACIWNGTHVYATSTGAKSEQSSYSSLTYGMDIETGWIKLADLQGFGAVRWLMMLGEYRSACAVRVRIAYNYAESDASGATWVDDKSFTVTPTTVGGPLQFRHGPKRHRVEAIKIRLTAHTAGDNTTPPAGEAIKLTGLALEVGFEPGLYKRLPAAQKQ